jgi:hypothetical protein
VGKREDEAVLLALALGIGNEHRLARCDARRKLVDRLES